MPIIESHNPATFRERGVAMPFTTPLLAGARARVPARTGIELLLPNPSGGRGVYVVHWTSAQEQYRPTVHDTVLLQRIGGCRVLDPRKIRAAGWDVAREGWAGQEACAAAGAAEQTDRSQRLLAEFQLLNALAGQLNPHGLKPDAADDPAAALARLRGALLNRLAVSFGRTGLQLGATLAALADVVAPVGATPNDASSRIARLVSQLQETRADMLRSFHVSEENDGIRVGRSITASMGGTLACATALLDAGHALVADPLVLLKQWVASPDRVTAVMTRAEWVLDGWERIALLWRSAGNNTERRGALREMAQLVPVLPPETSEWTGAALPVEATDPGCRNACQGDGGRGGVALVKIGANEKLRAMSL